MTSSLRRNRPQGPTRLMAAWVILGGSIVGIAVAAMIMPPPSPSVDAVWVDLPETADRYAAADNTGQIRTPQLNPMAADTLAVAAPPPLPEVVEPEPEVASNAPILKLTPISEAAPELLELTAPEDTGPIRPEDVVITVSGQRVDAETAEVRTGPSAPDPALMASSAGARRPAIGSDGRTPFDHYRRPDIRLGTAPTKTIALMVSGLGLDPALTDRAISSLPPEVTLSFAPYTKDLEAVMARAAADGHEVVLELPMEQSGVTPSALGTAALTTTRSPEANAKRLEWVLSRAPAYPMVTNYLGRTFSNNETAMLPVLEMLDEAGVGYIDDTGLVSGLARQAGIPYSSVRSTIPPGTSDVQMRLAQVASAAGSDPQLVKIYAGEGGLDGVIAWVQSDPRKEVTLVPASASVRP